MDSARAAVLVADRRATASVGRHARLELVFGCRGGRTILKHAYAEPPFRSGRCFADGHGVRVILATVAPGVFGGDCLTQRIVVENGARVRLHSQSALQAHPSPSGDLARLASVYTVDDDAELSCEWDPLIPFRNAWLAQQTHVDLASDARLFWSEALLAGREAHGERWAFHELRHELRIARAGSLEYLERYRLSAGNPPSRNWVGGSACCFGSAVRSGYETDQNTISDLHERLSLIAGARCAVDRLGDRLELVRVAAESGAAFRAARELMTGFA